MTAAAFDYSGEYDENWPLPGTLTLEQYSRIIFRPDAHFVDGRIVPRKLGDSVHGRAVVAVGGALQVVGAGFHGCVSLRLQISPTRIRVCDFVLLDGRNPIEPVPTIPPVLCVEVLAVDQSPEDELETLADYLAMGVRNIWVIDSVGRAVYTFDAEGLHGADASRLTIAGAPIHLDLTEAFATLD